MDFTKILNQIKDLWKKWTLPQKLILGGVVLVAVIAIAALVGVSSAPSMTPVISTAITDETQLAEIITRIEQENVKTQVTGGIVYVGDEKTARKMRAILISEGLAPKGADPWALFDRESWTITEFERNINLRRSITADITRTIKALAYIDNAVVNIVMPEETLFKADQKPVTVSVVLIPKPNVDLNENRKIIEGVQRIVISAVGNGVKAENITITDHNGLVLNDFEGMKEMDNLALVQREIKIRRETEAKYRADILSALQNNFSADRVRDLNINIQMDMSKKVVESSNYKPVMIKEQTPGLPYDDSVRVPSLTISETTSETTWKGTGFNPEGPAGVEGQTPPAYKDMQNMAGEVTQKTRTHNEVMNEEKIQEERRPKVDSVSVSVNIDGTWSKKYDEKGKLMFTPENKVEREYKPLNPEELAAAQRLVEGAIHFDAGRGDLVNVTNFPIDRTAQFEAEDAAIMKARQIQFTIIASLIGIAVLLIGFVVFQIIARAREQARRRREEELARQHQLMRESALLEAEKEGETISMSVEDQARMELAEKAIALAREHPQDVSQLIRTWLMED
ncbi:MAG: flagellar M-ring protein FliF [Spirochaetaceae bacterium]|jgi:flagellar M-ring protein FliF|nr:flagellar M-ring protein FliF [Spirochaetaceae bacterium]